MFFISVDPERDTPETVKNYLSNFNNNFIGITGEPEKIFLLSKSWGVLSEKIFNEDGSYLINHSSSILLLDNGKYIGIIDKWVRITYFPRDEKLICFFNIFNFCFNINETTLNFFSDIFLLLQTQI